MAKTGELSKAPEQSSLKRVIGQKMLLFFVMGDILGAGIYVLVGKVAGYVAGMLWLPFLLAFILAVLTAAAYSELAGKYSQAAGAALYINKAFGIPFVTFIVCRSPAATLPSTREWASFLRSASCCGSSTGCASAR